MDHIRGSESFLLVNQPSYHPSLALNNNDSADSMVRIEEEDPSPVEVELVDN